MAAFSMTLNRRIKIMKQGGSDELGQIDPNAFVELRPAWASIRNMTGAEAIRAGAMSDKVHCSVRLRYCTDVIIGMHVEQAESAYVVRAVLPDEVQRRHVDLVCEVLR